MSSLVPPRTPAVHSEFAVHDVTINDEFCWLKAENWKAVLADPQTIPDTIKRILDDENTYTEELLRPLNKLKAILLAEMRGRIKEDDSSVPSRHGPFDYFSRFEEGAEHPLICRRAAGEGHLEQILLDCVEIARNVDYFDLGDSSHSPDHRLLAWSSDETGAEYYRIRCRDIDTGSDGADLVERTDGSVVWAGGSDAFFYVALDENHRPSRVMRHRIGTEQADDALVLEATDPGHFINIAETLSGAFLTISITDHETAEVWLVDRHDPGARPRLVAAREPELRYSVDHRGTDLIIKTNADGADDGRIVVAPVDAPERANWRDLVPPRAGVMIVSHAVFARHLVRLERENATPRIVIRNLAHGAEHAIAFAEETYSLWLMPGYEFDTDILRFGYSSMTTPAETYDYDMASRERVLRKRQEVPSGHDPQDYVTRRLMVPSHDGELVPVSLLHRRDLQLDGTAPCLLYGYGSYGIAISASFRTNVLSLVDRGFVYAIAHVRGGTERGWRWYKEGKREKKPNTFKDFIAVGEALAAKGFTGRGRIVAQGGSAGGMLIGAAANMAPQLFCGIIAEVPFVDVLNTMLDAELPLTPPEWPEWGNPIEDRTAFETIRSYSPYDNVKPQHYPAILALGGLADPRVTYWEPAKWVARLRATMTGGGPVLLKTNMTAGHGGASGRFDHLKDVALVFAFAIHAANGGFEEAALAGRKP